MLRRYTLAVNPEVRWNWDGVMTHALLRGEAVPEFSNFWFARFVYEFAFPAYDDEEKGIVGTYRRPYSHTISLRVDTDQRSSLFAQLMGGYTADGLRKQGWWASVGVTWRPFSWVELNPVVYYSETRDEEAWVFPDGNITDPAVGPDPFSVFGDRDVDYLDFELRGIVTFTRSLSLQFFGQVFLARGAYDQFRRLTTPTSFTSYDYTAYPGYYSHDFNTITFNANVLLRWEYLPGSAVYLVWTQARNDYIADPSVDFGTRFRETFTLPRQDVLLLKVSYWFSI
jgi:hypothetical protein